MRSHALRAAKAAIASVMVLAGLEVLPIEALALIAATVVVATGCLTPDEAMRRSTGAS